MDLGLHFCKVDLHVHTPASECHVKTKITPADIIMQAKNSGMKAIAITDHNGANWIDSMLSAAIGTGIIVFPGVEINVSPGVHIVAIFPEYSNSANIIDLLTDLGLTQELRNKNDSIVTKYGIDEVCTRIRNANALPILAHIDSDKGVWTELQGKGQSLIQVWEKSPYAAVEITRDQLPQSIGTDPFLRKPAYYWASDNPDINQTSKHSHLGIGSKFSQFKLSEPITWEGLRLCFQDPSTRIRLSSEIPPTHSLIEKITINGGFLDGFDIEINPNLNCFIGGRGTGKSCLLELIRYGFGLNAKTNQNQIQADSLLGSAFPFGSHISIQCRVDESSVYRIERYSGDSPNVYRIDEDEPIDVSPMELLPIQVYGQKEIYEISQDPNFQLRLVDNYLDESIRPIIIKECQLIRDLEENAQQLINLGVEIENTESEVASIGSVNEEIRRMEKQEFTEKLTIKNNYDREKELITAIKSRIENFKTNFQEHLSQNKIEPVELEKNVFDDLINKNLIKELNGILPKINQLFSSNCQSIISKTIALESQFSKEISDWQKSYDEQEKVYKKLMLDFQNDGLVLDPNRYISLKQKQRYLQGLAASLKHKKGTLQKTQNKRDELLMNLLRIRSEQFELRQAKAQELSSLLNRKVRVTIWPNGNRNDFFNQLVNLFEGTHVRKETLTLIAESKLDTPYRQAQHPFQSGDETHFLIKEIPQFLNPIDLAVAIRKEMQGVPEEESDLIKKYSIFSSAMRNNLASISQEKLLQLELLAIPDLPVIELQVSSGELGYKKLDSLSIGQKCTALLSLVLLESTSPLLIDQPEDDLDNHFIFDQIVTTLRNAKEKRQFIISTHNANIPVSGDAELIIVLKANERKGWIEENGMGSIDSKHIKSNVEHLLEGGENAFIIRKEKYGIM